ncbi:MAG: carbohydrate ABC transporter permease [Oscillospiraceae bacterium]
MKKNKFIRNALIYIFLTATSLIMLYPLLWLFGASFKSNREIFSSLWFMPEKFDFSAYVNGWKTSGTYTMGHYFINTFKIVIPRVVFSVISSVITAYGFARFEFPLKKQLFSLLIFTMILPETLLRIPSYRLWNMFGMLDTYFPLILPSALAGEGLFVFMLVQFFKGIPKELDEAAKIDGCNSLQTLVYVLVPCIRPAVVSVGVFSFLWSVNNFVEPLIYISSVKKYPITLAVRMSMDSTGQGYEWNSIIAMSLIGLIPSVLVFLLAQKYFTSGISTSGISG